MKISPDIFNVDISGAMSSVAVSTNSTLLSVQTSASNALSFLNQTMLTPLSKSRINANILSSLNLQNIQAIGKGRILLCTTALIALAILAKNAFSKQEEATQKQTKTNVKEQEEASKKALEEAAKAKEAAKLNEIGNKINSSVLSLTLEDLHLYAKKRDASQIHTCKIVLEDLRATNPENAQKKQSNLKHFEEILQACPNLKTLQFCSCVEIEDGYFDHLKEKSQIETLALLSCDAFSLEKVSALQGLKELTITGRSSHLKNENLEHLHKLESLQTLTLSGLSQIQVEALEHLKKIPQLKTCSIDQCWRVNDPALDSLQEHLTEKAAPRKPQQAAAPSPVVSPVRQTPSPLAKAGATSTLQYQTPPPPQRTKQDRGTKGLPTNFRTLEDTEDPFAWLEKDANFSPLLD